jgi:hypothetical protein
MIFRQYIYLEKLLPADRIIDLLPVNVSQFAHPEKHCCGNKICFPESKNVSQ